MNDITVEICCGSYYDALEAARGGAKRIELNSALALGGLTPSISALDLVKQETPLKVIAMARPRGAGFCYGAEDFKQMLLDCQALMSHGADGIAFGCLRPDRTIDLAQTRIMVNAVKDQGGEVVFHRAFDCVVNPYEAAEQLISLQVDRILTSGQKATALKGRELIGSLQSRYGSQIQILAGSGIRKENVRELIRDTKISQVHSSCKDWRMDPTTAAGEVSYAYGAGAHAMCYDVVSAGAVREFLQESTGIY